MLLRHLHRHRLIRLLLLLFRAYLCLTRSRHLNILVLGFLRMLLEQELSLLLLPYLDLRNHNLALILLFTRLVFPLLRRPFQKVYWQILVIWWPIMVLWIFRQILLWCYELAVPWSLLLLLLGLLESDALKLLRIEQRVSSVVLPNSSIWEYIRLNVPCLLHIRDVG